MSNAAFQYQYHNLISLNAFSHLAIDFFPVVPQKIFLYRSFFQELQVGNMATNTYRLTIFTSYFVALQDLKKKIPQCSRKLLLFLVNGTEKTIIFNLAFRYFKLNFSIYLGSLKTLHCAAKKGRVRDLLNKPFQSQKVEILKKGGNNAHNVGKTQDSMNSKNRE